MQLKTLLKERSINQDLCLLAEGQVIDPLVDKTDQTLDKTGTPTDKIDPLVGQIDRALDKTETPANKKEALVDRTEALMNKTKQPMQLIFLQKKRRLTDPRAGEIDPIRKRVDLQSQGKNQDPAGLVFHRGDQEILARSPISSLPPPQPLALFS